MIVVDSSVWIAELRGLSTPPVYRFQALLYGGEVIVGDLIVLEVLQGARSDAHAESLERTLRQFPIMPMCDVPLAVAAARHYRVLRSLGITPRKTVDLIIGTFCIEHGHDLLHDDRDFEPMHEHLGLRRA